MKYTVLLVEDDQWLADAFRHALETHGHECRTVSSSGEALEAIDTALPNVIVLDFLLPGVNAMQLLHELQSYDDSYDIPVIVCTTLQHIQQQASSLEAYGVRLVLDKATITPKKLGQAVQDVIV